MDTLKNIRVQDIVSDSESEEEESEEEESEEEETDEDLEEEESEEEESDGEPGEPTSQLSSLTVSPPPIDRIIPMSEFAMMQGPKGPVLYSPPRGSQGQVQGIPSAVTQVTSKSKKKSTPMTQAQIPYLFPKPIPSMTQYTVPNISQSPVSNVPVRPVIRLVQQTPSSGVTVPVATTPVNTTQGATFPTLTGQTRMVILPPTVNMQQAAAINALNPLMGQYSSTTKPEDILVRSPGESDLSFKEKQEIYKWILDNYKLSPIQSAVLSNIITSKIRFGTTYSVEMEQLIKNIVSAMNGTK